MPPPRDGNEPIPFERLIKLERLNKDTFRSIALPFTPDAPNGVRGVAYGGHVYMQAAWAACQTVAKGFQLSNVSGNFILPGTPDLKFTYHVQTIRDGRSSATRIVNVSQKEGKGFMFTCTCVFKNPEPNPLDVQSPINLWDKYAISLKDKQPWSFPECPGFDVPWYWREQANGKKNDIFPGLDTRKADLSKYNQNRHPLDRRQLVFYRSIGTIPADDVNMHLCAQLYASDRNSLFIVANALDIGDLYTGMGSLIHQVIFHTGAEDLGFGEDVGEEGSRWFCKEDSCTRYANGRGLFFSRVWSPEGRHVMTVTQDGMVRLPREGGEGKVEDVVKGWDGLEPEEMQQVRRGKGKL
ncbi:hypothetical protein M409DRAFT_53525 [Zasmidium cellare ATCC 36951]|uniref:Acyl-CoA thioesterase II n=1 Tax=Zasmidium cellare ATCC 36951 TaxID=1080233 RepID=A0A6A6CRW2_ZASCE|nr:uncharacterized protein M409DRAFT_53525 [Zasmidium cellare ATCC 36951]KAF2168226.1 hypothetical protein M409DRAFT_53525 [Zasmidium cellare ATCC 36951]